MRAQQNLGHIRTQEKGAVTPQETEPNLAFSWSLLRGVDQQRPAARVGALATTVLGALVCWAKASPQGGNTSTPISRKVD